MRLIIVRHGEPDYEHDSLTEKGWREAELLSKRLCETDVTAFYSSPLGRAEATSKPTLEKLGRTAEILPWLQEFPACRIDEKTGEAIFMWDILPEEWTAKKEYYDRDRWLEEKTVALGNGKAEYERVASGLDALLAKHGYVRDGELYRVERENRHTCAVLPLRSGDGDPFPPVRYLPNDTVALFYRAHILRYHGLYGGAEKGNSYLPLCRIRRYLPLVRRR